MPVCTFGMYVCVCACTCVCAHLAFNAHILTGTHTHIHRAFSWKVSVTHQCCPLAMKCIGTCWQAVYRCRCFLYGRWGLLWQWDTWTAADRGLDCWRSRPTSGQKIRRRVSTRIRFSAGSFSRLKDWTQTCRLLWTTLPDAPGLLCWPTATTEHQHIVLVYTVYRCSVRGGGKVHTVVTSPAEAPSPACGSQLLCHITWCWRVNKARLLMVNKTHSTVFFHHTPGNLLGQHNLLVGLTPCCKIGHRV